MSEFDKDALFSDIDKILEKQGFSNISSSSSPIEVEASLEPEPVDPASTTPEEILNRIQRVVNPEEYEAKMAQVKAQAESEQVEAAQIDNVQADPSQNDASPSLDSQSENAQIDLNTVESVEAASAPAAEVQSDISKPKTAYQNTEEFEGPAVSSFSSTADIVHSEYEANLDNKTSDNSAVISGTDSSDKFTTIDQPMEWSLNSAPVTDDTPSPFEDNPPVSYLEGASSDGVQVENVAFGDVSVGIETESVEFSVGHPLLRLLRNILIVVALALVISLVITKFLAHHTSVDGSSMSPTLTDGDQLIVEQLSYYFHDPDRFDIVVFPISTEDDYIKRIIGLPGETVQILNGQVYINGNLLTDDRYGAEMIEDPGMAADTIYLQPDEYFVLGDNRNASVDSRFPEVGLIHKKDIQGRAWLRFYPFGSFGSVK